MGLTLAIVYEPEPENEDAQLMSDIKFVLDNIDDLDELANRLGVTPITMLGGSEDIDEMSEDPPEFFDLSLGIETLDALLKELKKNPKSNPESDEPQILLDELAEMLGCLRLAAEEEEPVQFCFLVVM